MMDSCGGVSSGCKRWLTLLGGTSGLSSNLEYGGRQMFRSRGRGLLDPEHGKDAKVIHQKMVDPTMQRWQQLGYGNKCTGCRPCGNP
jgi:hypothetical protein